MVCIELGAINANKSDELLRQPMKNSKSYVGEALQSKSGLLFTQGGGLPLTFGVSVNSSICPRCFALGLFYEPVEGDLDLVCFICGYRESKVKPYELHKKGARILGGPLLVF